MEKLSSEYNIGFISPGYLVNQDSFYLRFSQDIRNARKSVEIVSPYVSTRYYGLIKRLGELVKNGVKVIVYTKPPSENEKPYQVLAAEEVVKVCTEYGIKVFEQQGIHQKIAIVDNKICWEGSLNILSHSWTKESMRRLEGELIVAEHRDVNNLRHPDSLWSY